MRFFGQTFFYKNNRNVGKDRVIRYYLGNTQSRWNNDDDDDRDDASAENG